MSVTCWSGASAALLWLSLSSISYIFGERRGNPIVMIRNFRLNARTKVARSHLDRHLAVLAELRLLSGQPRLGELENSNGSARRSIPQFRRDRLDPQQAYVSIVHDTGAAGDRQVGLVARIDKDKADIGRGLDLILLGAVNIGHEKNQAG